MGSSYFQDLRAVLYIMHLASSCSSRLLYAQAKYDKNEYEPQTPGSAFTRKREVIAGRAAMSGFVSALIGEFLTGKGALGQLQLGEHLHLMVSSYL